MGYNIVDCLAVDFPSLSNPIQERFEMLQVGIIVAISWKEKID